MPNSNRDVTPIGAAAFENRIIAETKGIIAWNKPPGVTTSGSDLDDPHCAQYGAMNYVDDMVWVLHQLDRDTSGVLLFAKKKHLVAQWQNRWGTSKIRKFYTAMVHGTVSESPLTIDAPLARLGRRGYTEVAVDETGKSATTVVWSVDSTDHYSLVIAQPITGRTHQIRAHLQHVGCPLVGEERYNAIPCGYHHRHALHALSIVTDRRPPLDHIEAPPADDLNRPAEKLGLDLRELNRSTVQYQLP